MSKMTISEIKKHLNENRFSKTELNQLRHDQRVGVQNLLNKLDRQMALQEEQKQKFDNMLVYEKRYYKLGKQFIAGMDEAGRGPLAGPVVAAAVILNKNFYLPGLDDSKRLTKQKREEYFSVIKEQAISFGIGIIHNDEIDEINIFQATKKAMRSALQQLNPMPDHVLIDAVQLDNLLCTSESIIKGDQKSISIAAASIIAKVTRDQIMERIHEDYPYYNFQSNSGYGTKEHLQAIKTYGISPYHRHSFAPVKETIE